MTDDKACPMTKPVVIGMSDILWIDTSGDLGIRFMNGLSVSSQLGLGNVGTRWQVQGQNAADRAAALYGWIANGMIGLSSSLHAAKKTAAYRDRRSPADSRFCPRQATP
jgi:hypothetical protein